MVLNYKILNFTIKNHSSFDSGLGSQDQNLHFKKTKQLFRVLSTSVWENFMSIFFYFFDLSFFPRVYGRITAEFMKFYLKYVIFLCLYIYYKLY